jgi:hypothetical protein
VDEVEAAGRQVRAIGIALAELDIGGGLGAGQREEGGISVMPRGPQPMSRQDQPGATPMRSSMTAASGAMAAPWTCSRSISPARCSMG